MEKQAKLQWHPAFFAGIQIELAAEARYLVFENEHQLGTKPKEIDVLIIKKENTPPIRKNIGRIFRTYNLVEYKSPADTLDVEAFYKLYGYACFYKADASAADRVPMEEVTLTFISHHYPGKLMRYLEEKRNYQIQKADEGIYYITGDYIPIQILVTRQLSKTENLWLSHLTNQLDGEPDAELLVEEYQKHTKDKLYQSVMDIIVRANHEMFEEAKEMCDALRELFADEFKENRREGLQEGRQKGLQEGRQEGLQKGRSEINRLILKLSELGRTDDILKAAQDPAYQEQLLKELHL
ncbi:3-isopropylmalate dehydrogenase [Mordavella massiliensis]|nr:3-isopropylmalate dehydrogenase [Mordavella massiliensis]